MQIFLKLIFVLVVCILALNNAHAQEDIDEVPSSLLDAVVQDDVLAIRQALRDGSDIDTTNVNGWTTWLVNLFPYI